MILDDLNSKKRYVLSIASFTLQSIIGLFMGHHFDMQIFYVAGNAVSNGFAPYGIFYPSLIFNSPNFFERISGIGYPPPWGFFLGLVYMFVYEPTKNIYAYNLAIKIPSILSNIALAFIGERIAIQEGLRKTTTSRIFLFFLFNPLLIYISAIWGQFDSLVILTCIMGLVFLTNEKIILSSLLFAVSVSLKIIPFVLLPAMLLFIKRNYGLKQISKFILPFSIFSLILTYIPFVIFNWDFNIIRENLDVHFIRAGCFTLFNIFNLIYNIEFLPKELEFLGFLWIPGLFLAYLLLNRTSLSNRLDLFRWASSIIFILLLTRSWVSEQNIVLLMPLVMLGLIKDFKRWIYVNLLTIIVFIFTFLNTSPFQMFFLISSESLEFIRTLDLEYRFPRLFLKFLIIIPWHILGWIYIKHTLNPVKNLDNNASSILDRE